MNKCMQLLVLHGFCYYYYYYYCYHYCYYYYYYSLGFHPTEHVSKMDFFNYRKWCVQLHAVFCTQLIFCVHIMCSYYVLTLCVDIMC